MNRRRKLLFRADTREELVGLKRRVPSADWPICDASEDFQQQLRNVLHPNGDVRKLDLEMIAGWSSPVSAFP